VVTEGLERLAGYDIQLGQGDLYSFHAGATCNVFATGGRNLRFTSDSGGCDVPPIPPLGRTVQRECLLNETADWIRLPDRPSTASSAMTPGERLPDEGGDGDDPDGGGHSAGFGLATP
jgi:hypothetical protein